VYLLHLLWRWSLQSFKELNKRRDDHCQPWAETRFSAKALAVEADWERLLTLLGVSYRDQVPPDIVKKAENASEQWRRGEKALAHIHLAFTAWPRLASANDAYRLYLAEALLDDGLPPREMLAELGLGRTMRQLDKFDPDQSRVPAGSGQDAGRLLEYLASQ